MTMQLILGGRGEGKTTKLLQWLIETKDGVLLVHDARERSRLLDMFPPDYFEGRILVASEARQRLKTHRGVVAVDNVDLVLASLLGCHVDLVAMTGEPYVEREPDGAASWHEYMSWDRADMEIVEGDGG